MREQIMTKGVSILGIFAADLAFRAPRLPRMGETLLGSQFDLGPGGKGSNQAVAAARAGRAPVALITRIGRDAFAEIGLSIWRDAGIDTRHVRQVEDAATGTAFIFISSETGDNAIIVTSGAAGGISEADLDAAADTIAGSAVFVTQFEQPVGAAGRGLALARRAGVTTILNPAPAPATPVDDAIFALCDYVTPNETEASAITGRAVDSLDDARAAADALLSRGAGAAVISLGEKGALFHARQQSVLVPAFPVSKVVDTTGAGDAFNGAFAAALAEGRNPLDATRFACAAAAISVGRPGTAAAMPQREEIDASMRRAEA
jgi:ribokinase